MIEALKKAKLAGHYVPELEDCYFRYDGFHTAWWFVYQAH